jgi:hypothetical protein
MISTVLAVLIGVGILASLWFWAPGETSRFNRNVLMVYVGYRMLDMWWSGWPIVSLIGTTITAALIFRAWRLSLAREARQARDRHEAIR